MKKFLIILFLFIALAAGCKAEGKPDMPQETYPIFSEGHTGKSASSEDITEPPAPQEAAVATTYPESNENYIGNKKSKKFHRPDCKTLPAQKNRVYFTEKDEAFKKGYSPCGNCLP